jgi:ribosomal protein L40E
VSSVVFFVVKLFIHDKAAPTKTCSECLETIPAAAKRCRACTSPQPAG